jgi:hypothetical protein
MIKIDLKGSRVSPTRPEENVMIERNLLNDQVVDALNGGDGEGYFRAVTDLARCVGRQLFEQHLGDFELDTINTLKAAAMILRDMPSNDETKQRIISGRDWTALSDTLDNHEQSHVAEDPTSTINSEKFGQTTARTITNAGCNFVTARIVAGEDEWEGDRLKVRHSPWRVEVRVRGF